MNNTKNKAVSPIIGVLILTVVVISTTAVLFVITTDITEPEQKPNIKTEYNGERIVILNPGNTEQLDIIDNEKNTTTTINNLYSGKTISINSNNIIIIAERGNKRIIVARYN